MSSSVIKNRCILITGATSGLGRALALALAGGGNTVVVTGRRAALLETLVLEIQALGGHCITAAVDATDTVAVANHLQDVIGRVGRIDIAILNAGGGAAHSLADPATDAAFVLDMMQKNYATLVNYLCPLIDHMRDHGGTIAWTGSPAGMFGLPKSGGYSAAKAAGRMLFDTARIELAHTRIRFVALYPGFTLTEGLNPKDVPHPALIIQTDRAVAEMVWAIERQKSHHIFPRRIDWTIRFARLLPEQLRRRLLQLGI
jgi:NADP-dependent 3-hydroxy acid dehydrogenase YdfG